MDLIDSPSPQSIRFSIGLERMMKSLTVGVEPNRLTVPSSHHAHLDVAACYSQLGNSKDDRLEDTVMRQALELYCSLITPPASPSIMPSSAREASTHFPSTSSSSEFNAESGYLRASFRSPFGSSPLTNNSMLELNRPFSSGDEYSSIYFQQLQYNMSTPSPSASEQGSFESDEMDDPFASYTMSYQSGNTIQSRVPSGRQSSPHRRTFSEVPGTNGIPPLPSFVSSNFLQYRPLEALAENESIRGDAAFRSFQHTPQPHRPACINSHTMLMPAKSVIWPKSANTMKHVDAIQLSPPNDGADHSAQMSVKETKTPGRKRAFSVVSFGRHRKTLSTPFESLAISGPISIPQLKSPRTKKHLTRVGNDQSMAMPAAPLPRLKRSWTNTSSETNLNIVPIETKHQGNLAKPTGNASNTDLQPYKNLMKSMTRSETKSIWKSLKTKTSRRSLSIDRCSKEP